MEMSEMDLPLLERWLTGWSLSRGVPPPVKENGGLRVEVGMPLQLRRYVFLDAGQALQACADRIHAPHIYLKAPVDPAVLRAALPARWTVETPGYLMQGPASMSRQAALPAGYTVETSAEHGARLVRVLHANGELAASGRITLDRGTGVFDQIVTSESHRRLGLGTVVMQALDALARQANVTERLLVATEEGRSLYTGLGWQLLAPWATAVLPAPAQT
ncbi:GNAT family acetyltransferase [Massilia sp. Root418]|uniref:GNAT family N-acetyltransferase n=1 Tax=Massilia sp. Root418 TaxID=1736532 RepID=UPI0006FD36A5|nr:GNAT family N-acetyltransferase [Massilia sp. Root418]KQX01170.1 GNAT family acetyltransferase [Massilia sp. Root418]